MAKVATGQKLNRLPPGKIFGMAVTAPNATQISSSSSSSSSTTTTTNQQEDKASSENAGEIITPSDVTISESRNSSQTPELNAASFSITKTEINERSKQLFNVNQKNENEEREQTKETSIISQTSVETLARLFPNTKLSVLQLVLQRCGQDLLKAIEYFANDNNNTVNSINNSTSTTSSSNNNNCSSAFRPLQSSSSEVRQSSEYSSVFSLPPIYSNFSRNLYGDGYCLLNIPSEYSGCNGLTFPGSRLNNSHEHDNNVAVNVQYNNYFNANVQQQLREHTSRSGLLHLPPIIPGIPCVQPNCTQCYKFI
ncbi:hypothetical protein PV328_000427 [Microctonus aethiopoides]|nr:hypothetical protein PV328_000427 [Microctonus aethiopoides]